jgi:hypothetical protein
LASSDPRNKNIGAVVQTMTESLYGGLRSPLLLLQGAVGIVLLIGCANVAGLLRGRHRGGPRLRYAPRLVRAGAGSCGNW